MPDPTTTAVRSREAGICDAARVCDTTGHRSALDLARRAAELARQATGAGDVAVAVAAASLAAQYLQLHRISGLSNG